MRYRSTRGGFSGVTSSEAIKMGIAPDGGLFVPEDDVTVDLKFIENLVSDNYRQRAEKILSFFLTDFDRAELEECVKKAYGNNFSSPEVTPLVHLHEHLHMLELWHGPTCAFKDMALQILPHFMVKAIKKTGENSKIVILTATSGDTGKAALEGFADVDGTYIIVFYPNGGVSEIQRLQMVTQTGKNTNVIAVNGNFDDTQSGVKKIFNDKNICDKIQDKGFRFSSANSINWGRLVPQIVYYFSAYADLLKDKIIEPGEKINFVVPTGNFGNILAAWYAMKMGLPVNRLICASNENNILTDFIITGTYDRRREFHKTLSPSMDILISSNLERLLFELGGKDAGLIRGYMNDLNEKGYYTVNKTIKGKIQEIFWGGYSSDNETLACIRSVYKDYGYVLDTHTAVAMDVYDKYVIYSGDLTQTVIVSTASPFKFSGSVAKALFGDETEGLDEFGLLRLLSEKTGWEIPKGLKDLDRKEILHKTVCEKDEMGDVVLNILNS
ncbi:threonine synthase ThrC [Thermoclostridium stercorarium subsp. stercorarium DSM 8532]|uniref:Threonine synthase n=1 Tax=Thermoclostridium stercorarium (strain ATCC 35414 / DSM 8532 / NCIMB 11754) TaxID=1121335 RepID=L7VS49_THES1|nr:threonine synthase [Thermoclostridium stercorarium]AGC68408.1 threonine synthase ThrC [Thermoclostridium stercorarium subsp. stercorarium DSM 8532]AGI39428.1 L-threonine synthase [Thermoclostridium stercorarium subsp. stercorarium DSM 8532]